MATPLTFGVEFEMCVADGVERGVHTDPRIINFNQNPYGDDDADKGSPPEYSFDMPYTRVARHMAATLRAAGFRSTVDTDDNRSWDFTSDLSVEAPQENEEDPEAKVRYTYEIIELRTPALYFTPESLDAVADVLKLLKRTYLINTNVTTGLHVHVGDGKKGWPFSISRKFYALIWAFENQLRTLFPPSRLDGEYTKTMRELAWYARDVRRRKGRRPTPMEGLVALWKCESHPELQECFRSGTFRMDPAAKDSRGEDNRKPTIEWRHHEGTMDEASVCIWIKTVVGTMEYLRTVRPADFTDLLSIVGYEKWEKLGDGQDEGREEEMGPVLAEGEFTIIDLLQVMGLYEPAEFYQKRGLYRIAKDEKCSGIEAYSSWLVVPRPVGSSSEGYSHIPEIPLLNEDEVEIVGEGTAEDTSDAEDIDATVAEVVKLLAEGLDD